MGHTNIGNHIIQYYLISFRHNFSTYKKDIVGSEVNSISATCGKVRPKFSKNKLILMYTYSQKFSHEFFCRQTMNLKNTDYSELKGKSTTCLKKI